MHQAVRPDLRDPSLYFNRELSVLEFDRRVLAQAEDPAVPLLERLRFLTICSTNLDEFFEVRVAGLKQQMALGYLRAGPDGLSPKETLQRISASAHRLVADQYRILNTVIVPALAAEGIRLLNREDQSARQARWLKRYFRQEVLPVLTPIGLDPAHPFPKVLNKGLCLIASLEGPDAFGRSSGIAVVQVPRALPRVLRLPEGIAEGPYDFVLLSKLIQSHVDELFPGMQVKGCYTFRVTRNSELWVDEEETGNLLQALEGELPSRNYGDAVRLEVADHAPDDVAAFLLRQVNVEEAELYRVNGPVNLPRLAALHELVERPDLKYQPFFPGLPHRVEKGGDLFETIRAGDVLLHHPYESFAPVLDLVRQAAADPGVLAIKQTLYRTGSDSPLVAALLDAARAGKEVTVLIELRARFDEAANIGVATRLQEAGANVVYGIVGYKCHAKMLLIVRREGRRLRRYVHLGTGNYHSGTVRAYTDFGLLTCDDDVGEDVHHIFIQCTGLGRATRRKRLLQSPFTLHETLLGHIDAEAERARAGGDARIQAKLNAITEPGIIQALYRASQAGVRIDLVVRGICCLRPGVPGVSENIRVRSIVGRFLEHHRVYRFHAGGEGTTFCSSADWMERNFFGRVEVAFPIDDAGLRFRVATEGLHAYLDDTAQAWELDASGAYARLAPGPGERKSAQDTLLSQLAE